jgi:hypothetical protein
MHLKSQCFHTNEKVVKFPPTFYHFHYALYAAVMLHWQSLYAQTSMILRRDIALHTCLGQVTEIEMILSV